jgi:hypothetical protein
MACKKDDGVMEQNLLKIVQLDGDYIARSCKELPDGSMIMACKAKEDPYIETKFGLLPSYLIKYSNAGELIWKKKLPSVVHVLHDFIVLKNGKFFITGYDNNPNSDNMGFVITDHNGNTIAQKSYFSQSGNIFNVNMNNAINAIQLANENIAVPVAALTSAASSPNFVRLIILDENLNFLTNRIYMPDNIVRNMSVRQLSIAVDQSDNLLISGKAYLFNDDTSFTQGFIMKLGAQDFNPVSNETYTHKQSRFPSNSVITDDNQTVWATSGPAYTDTVFNPLFDLNYQEIYSVGPEITVYKSNGDSSLRKKVTITGYAKYGYVSKIITCKDGGFALLGTCNINVNQSLGSQYRLLLIKLDRNLQMEWMKFPDTYASTVAASIQEIENGFLISATHNSFGKSNKPIFFKLSRNGLIQ